jgi:hypothetical protein
MIDYTPLGNAVFGTAPIGWEVWLFVVPFAVAMLVLEELRKYRVRARASGSRAARRAAAGRSRTAILYVPALGA